MLLVVPEVVTVTILSLLMFILFSQVYFYAFILLYLLCHYFDLFTLIFFLSLYFLCSSLSSLSKFSWVSSSICYTFIVLYALYVTPIPLTLIWCIVMCILYRKLLCFGGVHYWLQVTLGHSWPFSRIPPSLFCFTYIMISPWCFKSIMCLLGSLGSTLLMFSCCCCHWYWP